MSAVLLSAWFRRRSAPHVTDFVEFWRVKALCLSTPIGQSEQGTVMALNDPSAPRADAPRELPQEDDAPACLWNGVQS